MKQRILLLFFIILLYCTSAQESSSVIDLNGVFTGKYRIENYNYLAWRPASQQFTFVKSNSRDTLWIQVANAAKADCFLTKTDLQKQLPDAKINAFPAYEWLTYNKIYFPNLHAIFYIDEKKIKVEILPLHDVNIIDYDADNKLFITKNEEKQVFVLSGSNDFKPILLCPDTGKNIVFGETVHRSEWGINEGQYISPNAHYIAFYRMDESMVESYPLVNTETPIASLEEIKYPMAGRMSHQVKVGIFDVQQSVNQKKTVFHYIKTNVEDGEFLTNITFSPDEKTLYIVHLNREQNHSKLIEYDILTGNKKRVIIEEKDTRYVEPKNRPYFLKNNQFIWQSDRDGWNHCYLYDFQGNIIKKITEGNFDVIELLGVSSDEKTLFFTSNMDDPTACFLYTADMKRGSIISYSTEKGTHIPILSPDYQYALDKFTNLSTPLNISLLNLKTKKSTLLFSAKNPYDGIQLGKTEIFKIKNKAEDDLYCRIIYPPDFNPNKKYPCLIYVYGGPHSQLVTNNFMSGGVFLQYMAQKGYIVFTLDNRGTANRGADFEKIIHRHLGKAEMEDQICGLNYLKTKSFIDEKRIGLDGWSYGGFMTLLLVTTYPELFKSASCGGPVVNWEWYEVMYGERYMDMPQENPEGYKETNIIPKIKNLKTHLLVMNGAQDHTVVWQNSLQLLREAVKEGVQLDYFVYPNHDHNVVGVERLHLWKKIEEFHDRYLK
jgi:dipeptidyl-peptidase-4